MITVNAADLGEAAEALATVTDPVEAVAVDPAAIGVDAIATEEGSVVDAAEVEAVAAIVIVIIAVIARRAAAATSGPPTVATSKVVEVAVVAAEAVEVLSSST